MKVKFETADLAKAAGMIWQHIPAPSQEFLHKWMRDEYDIHITINKVYECSKEPAKLQGWCVFIGGPTFETDYEINREYFINHYFDEYEALFMY